jgi:hypothetical protein
MCFAIHCYAYSLNYYSQDASISRLPLLNIRPQIQLIRKRRPRLRMQKPIRIGNLHYISTPSSSLGGTGEGGKTYSIRANLRILMLKDISLRTRNINYAINNDMRDMHSLGTEFSCQRLREGPKTELCACEGAEEGRAADACRCTCPIVNTYAPFK